MAIPNTTGGDVHTERYTKTPYNNDGRSRAFYANQPNEKDWQPKPDECYDEEPRQCVATSQYRVCSNCQTLVHISQPQCPECQGDDFERTRCKNVAVPDYMTCKMHGGGFKQKPEVLAKAHAASMKTGMSVKEMMLCPCPMHGDDCPYAGMYTDKQGISRCLPEKQMYDSVTSYFSTYYEIDDAADILMLNRLAMTLVRIGRGEKILAKQGEIVQRTRHSPDGTKETWFEESAAARVVEKLDKRLQAWLKELAVTKSAREGRKVTVSGTVDIATLLTDIPKNCDDDVIDL